MNQPRQPITPDVGERRDDPDTIDLAEYVGMLRENLWFIAAWALAFFVVAVLYAIAATPIYRADALLQVEQESSPFQQMDELAAMMGGDTTSSDTEIEIIRSRRVLGEVIDRLGLAVEIEPRYLPLVGKAIARRAPKDQLAEPWLGFDDYAWGGEVLVIEGLRVPESLLGTRLTLTAGKEGAFRLFDADERELVQGQLGTVAVGEGGDLRLLVRRLEARPGTRFNVTPTSMAAALEDLRARVGVGERGRKTGVLSVSLEGEDRKEITSIVNAIVAAYLRQNVEQMSHENERMLAFISEQLPALKENLDASERALNEHRQESGTVNISVEGEKLIGRVAELEATISALQLERADLAQRFTREHPMMKAFDLKMQTLERAKTELDETIAKLPETELETVQLTRDVTVASELYMLLLHKAQELRVAKAGTVGNVRVVDEAMSGDRPVKPKRLLVVAVAVLLGLIVGVMLAAIRRAMRKVIEDPSAIEKSLGYPIYAEIPMSAAQLLLDKRLKRGKETKGALLAHVDNDDIVVESLRSLRTSLQFALLEADNNIVAISGPSPEIGKSFVSSNFAYVMAEADKRVLLIDADMRKGHIEKHFGLKRVPGLSEVVSGAEELEVALHRGVLHEKLDVLTSGVYPPNPSELLMSERFDALLEELQERYDLIVIDTPPVLAVTDPAIVARRAGTSFLVVRAGRHPMREVATAFRRFEQNGVKMNGAIFNGVEIAKGYRSYGYKYYSYQYRYR